MRNQAFLLAAGAAVVIGCGGGSHHSSTKSTTTTTGSGLAVNLDPSYGHVEISYLTGLNRAVNDIHFEIDRQDLENVGGLNLLSSDVVVRDLNLGNSTTSTSTAFQNISARINVPFAVTTAGRPSSLNFTQLPFQPTRAYLEGLAGVQSNITLPASLQPALLDARIRAFPGRYSVVPLRVSTQTYEFDSTTNAFTFNFDRFKQLNYGIAGLAPDDTVDRVASRLSDFVRFPLSGLAAADRPNLKNGYGDADYLTKGATYVYLSGDNVALSNGASGTGSIFAEVGSDPTVTSIGGWQNGDTEAGFVGTYDLRDTLPPSNNAPSPIVVSQYGSFRDYNTVLTGGGTFEVVMFPNSSETYTFEGSSTAGVTGRLGDMVAFVRNGAGAITNIYYGGVDLGAGTFTLFPIKALGLNPDGSDPTDPTAPIDSSVVNGISGKVSGYSGDYPSIRRFNYSFSGNLPTGFSASGTATVFRI